MKQILLIAMTKHIQCQKVLWNTWHRFTTGKSYLTNLIDSYNEMTSSEGERGQQWVLLDFKKVFHRVFS